MCSSDLNRHAECTDCHNPHRVVKFRSFIGAGGSIAGTPDPAGTHPHTDTVATIHTNILSGVLRGRALLAAWAESAVTSSSVRPTEKWRSEVCIMVLRRELGALPPNVTPGSAR